MFKSIKKMFDQSYKELVKVEELADQVLAMEPNIVELSDEDLQNKVYEFRERFKNGETLDDMLVEAFAVVREASYRQLGLKPYKVQIMGAAAIHGGNIAEMKTGEGKTLTAVLVAYLNAIPEEGVHIVTVNEYLAAREAEGEIGDLFRWLNLTVGLNIRELTKEQKRDAYLCDILYSTNNELGFDYLRDHMVLYKKDMVQRPLNFAIIDEVDSILIDEARTPLIISGGEKRSANLYVQANSFVRMLHTEDDFTIDIKTKSIDLTESGISKAERAFGIDNLYDITHVSLLHHINNALKANYTMDRDVDYVVQENQVIIVDQFTGRLMHGRQFSEGLHQALEAKEKVQIKKETRTMATITFQNYFRMYKKLSGMTGTAKTEEEEFRNIYNMFVVEVPTNKPIIRNDAPDFLFATMQAKYNAIATEIAQRHKLGQPILVGTVSIESSELLSSLLKRKGIKHDVLNAKQHEREAEIVEKAGEKFSVTIATNMAGRGTDIKLGEGVVDLGGLAVIGTERHESRRIDNQLRGRSGRQGDPGYTRFFLSAEDDLMRRFGGDRFKSLILTATGARQGLETPLESKLFSKQVEGAQKRIEGNNFDQRKTILQYDEVLRKQREIIYSQRNQILTDDDISDIVDNMLSSSISRHCYSYVDENGINYESLHKGMNNNLFGQEFVSFDDINGKLIEEVIDIFYAEANKGLEEKKEKFTPEIYKEYLKVIVLRVVDTHWTQHIDSMSELRQGIGLQAYAQVNPLREYQTIGFQMFEDLVARIEDESTKFLLRARIRDNLQREEVMKPISATSGKEDANRKRQPVKVTKVGRNDPCPCGSGLKYKHCHGKGE